MTSKRKILVSVFKICVTVVFPASNDSDFYEGIAVNDLSGFADNSICSVRVTGPENEEKNSTDTNPSERTSSQTEKTEKDTEDCKSISNDVVSFNTVLENDKIRLDVSTFKEGTEGSVDFKSFFDGFDLECFKDVMAKFLQIENPESLTIIDVAKRFLENHEIRHENAFVCNEKKLVLENKKSTLENDAVAVHCCFDVGVSENLYFQSMIPDTKYAIFHNFGKMSAQTLFMDPNGKPREFDQKAHEATLERSKIFTSFLASLPENIRPSGFIDCLIPTKKDDLSSPLSKNFVNCFIDHETLCFEINNSERLIWMDSILYRISSKSFSKDEDFLYKKESQNVFKRVLGVCSEGTKLFLQPQQRDSVLFGKMNLIEQDDLKRYVLEDGEIIVAEDQYFQKLNGKNEVYALKSDEKLKSDLLHWKDDSDKASGFPEEEPHLGQNSGGSLTPEKPSASIQEVLSPEISSQQSSVSDLTSRVLSPPKISSQQGSFASGASFTPEKPSASTQKVLSPEISSQQGSSANLKVFAAAPTDAPPGASPRNPKEIRVGPPQVVAAFKPRDLPAGGPVTGSPAHRQHDGQTKSASSFFPWNMSFFLGSTNILYDE
eukprot:GHVP01021241.1.p1 GENE.GHVP01021241.1~~GHVP01021241.1.p1  ORF type:complete len:604 (-),score=140.19 GHVP01021241.1:135-1946(-)